MEFAPFVRAAYKLYQASLTCCSLFTEKKKTGISTNYLAILVLHLSSDKLKPETAMVSISGVKYGIAPDLTTVDAEMLQCTWWCKHVHSLRVKFLPMVNILKPEVKLRDLLSKMCKALIFV
jgi:hypothetical protein